MTYDQTIEVLAVRGALADPRPDKTDWIRIWAIMRRRRALPCDAEDWSQAVQDEVEDGGIL